ncbi:protein nessun dorma [Thrips palmi]|uniref:Protein nessun dorma n=1 Tax=Thrips palmi TaxID=161013 RepID=A0A6P8Y572_THRPL|nr:protein nessun dorma [Thrips palmi]XP_034231191.1 protein nessun dorma [Thrips palmi]
MTAAMADCVYIFNKTREKRLEEFKDVLCSSGAPVLVTDVVDEWSCTLENFIEPTGWQALWKISRQICEELKIMFPKFVFVKVLSVDFQELTAFVEVEKVQDNISIPGKQEVPLIQLYPTKSQEDPFLNVEYTANFIDQLRFFFNHLWCPWDVEDTEGGDWPSKYLKPRLDLFYEMSGSSMPVKLVDKIHRSKEQARKLFEKKQELEGLIHKSSSEGLEAEDIVSPSAQSHTFNLMEVHLQLSPLLTELQLLENPSMRKIFIKHFIEEEERKRNNSEAIAVWESGSVDEFIDFLTACKTAMRADTRIVSVSSLQSGFESAVSGNTILVTRGTHKLNEIVESSISLIGIGEEVPTISGQESNSFLFNVRNAVVKIKNVKLDISKVASGLQVLKNSTVELVNCTITNDESCDGRGIVINCGGSVLIDGCKFDGLHVAVSCNSGSKVCIKNSHIRNCVFGIEAYENSELQIIGVSLAKCKEAGIFVSQTAGSEQTGDIGLLQKFLQISASQTQFSDNAHNVVLKGESNFVGA